MKKLNICLFHVVLLCIMLLFSANAFALEGDGSRAFPFLITNEEELSLINDFPECHFKLMNDIEMSKSWSFSIKFYGVIDGNNYKISNYTGNKFIHDNYGTIKNISISCGPIVVNNYKSGVILNSYTYGKTSEGSGFCLNNEGTIDRCGNYASINCRASGGTSKNNQKPTESYAAGFVRDNYGNISNSFSIGDINSYAYSYYWSAFAYASGFADKNRGNISNCYSIANTTASSGYGYGGVRDGNTYPFIRNNTGVIQNCFCTSSKTSPINVDGVTVKSSLAMKMKQTYTGAGWDFENVWGISPDLNDGYPYLLWEQEAPTVSKISVEINNVTVTSDKMKFISKASIDGNPAIDSFGTTFIPLQLFNNAEANVAIVQYDNSKYNISNGQTFGALLSDIPSSCKDVPILGKSFVKDSDGNYTWSAAKYASINDPILRESN